VKQLRLEVATANLDVKQLRGEVIALDRRTDDLLSRVTSLEGGVQGRRELFKTLGRCLWAVALIVAGAAIKAFFP
jgi:hypothetical protein